MFSLQGAQMLQMLENSLRKCLPESVKVYGTVFHIKQGNPFKLKVLVDKWPDFQTVVIRPDEQEMIDDLDHYTNTYQVYSKDPKNCQEFLTSPEVINWKQHLQIQSNDISDKGLRTKIYRVLQDLHKKKRLTAVMATSSQSGLSEVIQSLAATKPIKVKQTQNFLFMMPETIKKLAPSLLDTTNFSSKSGRPKAINEDMYKLSSLDAIHAALVNEFWLFGGNERSQRFIERCLRTFPSFCLLGPEGNPVSWSLMDQTGEIRMAGTLPEYRGQGLVSHVIYSQVQAMDKLGFPSYSHTTKSNDIMQKMSHRLHHVLMPCEWNQWNSVPL